MKKAATLALIIPITAVLHHAVFFRPSCMLNSFGHDYSAQVVADWLMRDPSLGWAALITLLLYRVRAVEAFAAPLFIAFLPLSLWIWDIPFSGRTLCRHFHDLRLVLLGQPVRTRHLYILGAVVFAGIQLERVVRRRLKSKSLPG